MCYPSLRPSIFRTFETAALSDKNTHKVSRNVTYRCLNKDIERNWISSCLMWDLQFPVLLINVSASNTESPFQFEFWRSSKYRRSPISNPAAGYNVTETQQEEPTNRMTIMRRLHWIGQPNPCEHHITVRPEQELIRNTLKLSQ